MLFFGVIMAVHWDEKSSARPGTNLGRPTSGVGHRSGPSQERIRMMKVAAGLDSAMKLDMKPKSK